MQPDRDAVITTLQESNSIELQSRVIFQPLVGNFNSARDLTTGVVSFGPKATIVTRILAMNRSRYWKAKQKSPLKVVFIGWDRWTTSLSPDGCRIQREILMPTSLHDFTLHLP